MLEARYMSLIPWTLRSGSEHYEDDVSTFNLKYNGIFCFEVEC
jgi:hypothetical protein